MTIRQVALLLVLLPSVALADGARFTDEEVRGNATQFIHKVFGSKPPTVKDLIYFEGADSALIEKETPSEYDACKAKFKTVDPANDSRCSELFDGFKFLHPEQMESLYYRQLRKRLGVKPESLQIESIRFVEGISNKTSGYFLVTVNVRDSNKKHLRFYKQLLLVHQESQKQVPEAGVISVEAVVMPIQDYLTEKR